VGEAYVEFPVVAPEPVEEEVAIDLCRRVRQRCTLTYRQTRAPRPPTHLRLDQHEVDEQHHEIMLDVFVRELVAPRALRQPHAFAERSVVRFRVFRVQCLHRVPAFDAYGHCIARGARGGGAGAGGWAVRGGRGVGVGVDVL
jgi:hypothetical protein